MVPRVPFQGNACMARRSALLLALAVICASIILSGRNGATPVGASIVHPASGAGHPAAAGVPQAAGALAPAQHGTPFRPTTVLYDQVQRGVPLRESARSSSSLPSLPTPLRAPTTSPCPPARPGASILVEVAGGYANGPGPATSVNVYFYLPTGAPVFSQTNLLYSPGPGSRRFRDPAQSRGNPAGRDLLGLGSGESGAGRDGAVVLARPLPADRKHRHVAQPGGRVQPRVSRLGQSHVGGLPDRYAES